MKWVFSICAVILVLAGCVKSDAPGVETHVFPYPSGDIKVAVWPRGSGLYDVVAFHPAFLRVPLDNVQQERQDRLKFTNEVINDGRCGARKRAVMIDEFQEHDINTMRWECQ